MYLEGEHDFDSYNTDIVGEDGVGEPPPGVIPPLPELFSSFSSVFVFSVPQTHA